MQFGHQKTGVEAKKGKERKRAKKDRQENANDVSVPKLLRHMQIAGRARGGFDAVFGEFARHEQYGRSARQSEDAEAVERHAPISGYPEQRGAEPRTQKLADAQRALNQAIRDGA